MAITLVSQPGNYVVATRPAEWVLTSDATDLAHLIARITIDSVVYPARILEITPTNDFRFDISEFLQEAFVKKLKTNNYLLRTAGAATIATEPGQIVSYTVDFWEETIDVDGLLTSTYPASPGYTSTSFSAVNITTLHTETVTANPYKADAATPGKFLSRAPLSKRICLNETEFLSIISNDTTSIYYVRIQTYDTARNLLGSYRIRYATQASDTIVSIPVGTASLNSLTIDSIVSGSAPILTDSVATYEVFTTNSLGTVTSEVRTYKIDRNQYLINRRFHWRNSLGAIDSFTFSGYEIEKRNTQYKTYQKFLGNGFSIRDRGKQVQQVQSADSFEVFTDLINKITCNWLAEIKDSSMVYVQVGSNFLPVILEPGESEVDDSSKAFQIFKLEYQNSFERSTQRG